MLEHEGIERDLLVHFELLLLMLVPDVSKYIFHPMEQPPS